MAQNVSGIAITIKAFLPTGKTLDEQFAALSIVKTAHETSDYAPLLAAAQIDEVKTEQTVRRVEDVEVTTPTSRAPIDEDYSSMQRDDHGASTVEPHHGLTLDSEEEPTTRQRRMAR